MISKQFKLSGDMEIGLESKKESGVSRSLFQKNNSARKLKLTKNLFVN